MAAPVPTDLLHQFWDNFRHNLFKPLLLFFYMGFSVPLLRVPFEFPHVIYQGLTIYLLVAIGWHGGEELAALSGSELRQALGFMLIGFVVNFIIGIVAYLILRGTTRLRNIDAATVAGYYGSDSAGTFVTCVGVLTAANIAYAAYMPVMLAVMEIPGCLVALYIVSRLRHRGMDAEGNMPGEPGYAGANSSRVTQDLTAGDRSEGSLDRGHGGTAVAAAPAAKKAQAKHSGKSHEASLGTLLHEVFLNPGLFLLFGGILIGFVSELQRKHEEVAIVEVDSQGDVHSILVAKDGEKAPVLDGNAAAGGDTKTETNAKPKPGSSVFVLPLQKARDVAKKVEPKKKDSMGQLDLMYLDLFQGALCLFLLEMGITACKKLRDLKAGGWQFIVFGVVAPNMFATIGMCVAHVYSILLGEPFQLGTYVLFAVLCGAASYIAVPAVQRMAIPEASPTLPLAASLGLTFSYNVTIGIPVYIMIATALTRAFPVTG